MAGVKGRSGGARPGAGRKKKEENQGAEFSASTEGMTPLQALEFFQNDPAVPVALRIKAAGLAAPFKHKRLGEVSKKEPAHATNGAGDGGTSGRFKTRTGPGATH